MTLGRAVSTTSPRLASIRMFCRVFSSTSSARVPQAGCLEGQEYRQRMVIRKPIRKAACCGSPQAQQKSARCFLHAEANEPKP